MLDVNLAAWLCWILPIIGGVLALLFASFDRRIRAGVAVLFSFLAWLMACLLLPELPSAKLIDSSAFWVRLSNNASLSIGMLIDPLSIILANVVAALGFIIMLY